MTAMTRFIEGMPKAELHVHVEGTLEPELKFDLARRNAINLPHRSVEEMRAGYDFDDLPSFLKVYYEGMSVLVTEQDFYDLTTAYLTKAHSQNVLYAEMFFDPQAHTTRGIAFDTVIRGIRRAQVDAQDKLGIRTQLIMCFLRDMSAESAMATLEQSLRYKDWIVGVGLDSDEKGNPLRIRRLSFRGGRSAQAGAMPPDGPFELTAIAETRRGWTGSQDLTRVSRPRYQASVTSTTAPPVTVGMRGISERISQLHSGASGTSSAPSKAASAARIRSTPSASSTVAAA